MTRSEASRINGAKSRGPVTPEGRARSAQNNYRHGFYARVVAALRSEDRDEFRDAIRSYIHDFQPRTIPEAECVVTIVNATWRMRRAEKDLSVLTDVEQEIVPHDDWATTYGHNMTSHLREALAFDVNVKQRLHTFIMLERTISACSRLISRALHQFNSARKTLTSAQHLTIDEILCAMGLAPAPPPPLEDTPQPEPPPPTAEDAAREPEPEPEPTTTATENSRFEPETTLIPTSILQFSPPTTGPCTAPKGENHQNQ